MNQEIAAIAPAQYVIFNFASPENLNLILEQTKNIIIPHFKKNMATSGMVGWGLGLKVTPQGTDYASMMTYDAYDNLENLMKHLSGGCCPKRFTTKQIRSHSMVHATRDASDGSDHS